MLETVAQQLLPQSEASLYCVGAAILSVAHFFHPLQRISGTSHSQQRISLYEEQG